MTQPRLWRGKPPAKAPSNSLLLDAHELGLPFPSLNYTVIPTKHARSTINKNHYKCNLFWQQRNLDVEYDSDAHHLGSERIAADAIRRNGLASLGITVIVVTRKQYNDLKRFDMLVRQIASILGKRMQYDSTAYFDKQLELRRMLADL